MGRPKKRKAGTDPKGRRVVNLERMKRAVDHYLSMDTPSYRGAMLAVGYSKSTAKDGYQFFKDPAVQAYMAERQAVIRQTAGVTPDHLIEKLKKIAFGDLSRFIKPQTDGTLKYDFRDASPEELALISELSVDMYQEGRGEGSVPIKKFRVGTRDQLRAIEILGRMIGAFNDSVTLNVGGVVDRLQAARQRVKPSEPRVINAEAHELPESEKAEG